MNITVRMPYLLSNIPSSMIYGSIYLELLQIALCALRLTDLYIYIYIFIYIHIYYHYYYCFGSYHYYHSS